MMVLKVLGALLIVAGCGGYGFVMTAAHRMEEQALRQLLAALDYMQCELQYHMTPLPDLCRQAGQNSKNRIGRLLLSLSEELERNISPDVSSCMDAALQTVPDLPKKATDAFRILGTSLGRFDAQGQIQGLESVRRFCRSELDGLAVNRDSRLRSYQTLGLCTGAALAILFV